MTKKLDISDDKDKTIIIRKNKQKNPVVIGDNKKMPKNFWWIDSILFLWVPKQNLAAKNVANDDDGNDKDVSGISLDRSKEQKKIFEYLHTVPTK